MPFQRKPGLGHYNATRSEWMAAYRVARVRAGKGMAPDPSTSGIQWKAQLIVSEREDSGPLSVPAQSRLEANKLINELLSEQNEME